MQRLYEVLCVFAVIVLSIFGETNSFELSHIETDAEVIATRKRMSNYKIRSGENDKKFWKDIGNSLLHQKLQVKQQYGVAKNVIFFLGDGMSITTLTASRIYMGQMNNRTGENEMLSFEEFPHTGLSKTYCVDSQVADSACSATAYLTGVKGNIETIGVSGTVSMRDCIASNDPGNQAESSMRWAQRVGKRTGVVTNMRVTHATPAGAYANVAHRQWECDNDIAIDPLLKDHKLCLENSSDIARQLIEKDTGRNLNVIMGGGRSKFLPNTTVDNYNHTGQRRDNRDLIQEWLNNRIEGEHKAYVSDRKALKSLNTTQTDSLLGLFAHSHMEYNLLADKTVEPTLVEMTEAAIEVLSKGDKGFYLFVEGGLIDWAHHDTQTHLALDETVMLSKAVRRALEMTSRDDTLIVVTSDHAHTLTLSGYPHRGSDILGHPLKAKPDKLPYSTLSYANGPSARPTDPATGQRYNLTNDDTSDPNYRFPSFVKLDWETHGGDDVAVFAVGPWSHLFVGNYEQNFIPHAISYASQMEPNEHRKDASNQPSSASKDFTFFSLVSLVFCSIVLNLSR